MSAVTAPAAVPTVIVVGGGLAGVIAAISAVQNGARVVLLEKEPKINGNSAKASSGINFVGSVAQKALGIDDTVEDFRGDVTASCGHLAIPHLIEVLVAGSTQADGYLRSLGVELDGVAQLGGHTVARTHRFIAKDGRNPPPVGFGIMSALESYVRSRMAEAIEIRTSCHVTKLVTVTEPHPVGERVVGVSYSHPEAGTVELRADAVVLTTGGFGFGQVSNSLLSKWTPWLDGMPTTNGSFATGEGVMMAEAAHAALVHMNQVQVHPTGFVDPSDPANPVKFLAPEALRGEGGILLNPSTGKRFVNELDRRDTVTAAMSQVCPTLEIRGAVDPAVAAEHHRLAPGAPRSCFGVIVMTEAGKNKFGPNFDFYCKVKGFVKQVHGAAGVASELKALGFDVPADVISSELAAYNAVATAGTKDAFGKTVFPDNFATALAADAPLYIARVCPAIHYTMGGVAISASAEVLRDEPQDNPDFMDGGDKDDPLEPLPTVQRPIPGLFAAGEVTGGVHGRNRLGGCSLLECVVFGRIAGERAAHALLTPATTITRDAFVPIRFREREVICPSIYLIRFDLPCSTGTLPCGVGKYVNLKTTSPTGEDVIRNYSPISRPSALGHIDFLIKCDAMSGIMTHSLCAMKPGDMMAISGPIDGPNIDLSPTSPIKKLGLICGGTGLSPMSQILREIFYSKRLDIEISMIYACPRPDSFPYYELLQRKAASHPNFKLTCTVDSTAGLPWDERVGFVTADLIREVMFPPSPDLMIVLCGPPPMCRAVKRALAVCGYTEAMYYSYM